MTITAQAASLRSTTATSFLGCLSCNSLMAARSTSPLPWVQGKALIATAPARSPSPLPWLHGKATPTTLTDTKRTRSPLLVRADAGAGPIAAAATVSAPVKELKELEVPSSFEYNTKMKRQMSNPYEYHHELGMYYTRITPQIIVGSQPQTPDDVTLLKEKEGVDVILNLQEDKDIAYWKVDLLSVQRRCQELGVQHRRHPAVDFDANSLRRNLPAMVAVIARAVSEGKTVYVHCTAGLGRSPAAAIAYLFWFSEAPKMDLQAAYDLLTLKRPCGPKWEAIRGVTYDLAKNSPYQPPLDHLPAYAFSDIAQWERDLIKERVWKLAA